MSSGLTSQYDHPTANFAVSNAELERDLEAARELDPAIGRALSASENTLDELRGYKRGLDHANTARQPHKGLPEEG